MMDKKRYLKQGFHKVGSYCNDQLFSSDFCFSLNNYWGYQKEKAQPEELCFRHNVVVTHH